MKHVDLNSDLGESFGAYKMGMDEKILPLITSANIACGFHAGDQDVMRKTVAMALKNGVAIGAHPGFQDLQGFGRRNMTVTPDEAYNLMVYQIGALWAFVKSEGGKLAHVKPHGALYNMAAKDPKLATALAEAVYKVDPELIFFALSGSEMIKAGQKIGLKTASEVFADRTYQKDGSLTPRKEPNAIIKDENESLAQVLKMVNDGKVRTVDGGDVPLTADTVCVHGDGEHALAFTKLIREKLTETGVTIKAIK